MSTTTRKLDPTTLLLYEAQIRNLLYAISYAQDRLDTKLFASLWTEECHVDMSGHLPGYPPMDTSNVELSKMTLMALGGFEATQHVVSNIVVTFDPQTPDEKANAKAMVMAYVSKVLGQSFSTQLHSDV